MLRPLVLALILLASAPVALANEDASPSALAQSLATQILVECEAAGAKTAAISIRGAAGLEGVPALVAVARVLEDRVFGRSLTEAPVETADVEIALVLSRTNGRIAVGGAVHRRGGRPSWVIASAPETPAWAPWLDGIAPPPTDSGGFTWRRIAALTGEVVDADAGDLDGDGVAEIVAVTRDEALVLRVNAGDATIVARVALPPGEPSETATRAPRAFVRVVPGAGGPGEVLVRFTDERRTRALAWDPATGSLDARPDRDGIVLASRLTVRGPDVIALEAASPGTNHFVDPPRVKRGAAWKQPVALGAWLDLREADLTATARIAEAGAVFGLLDAEGTLRLLRSDLTEISRIAKCGAAYALADWDGDAKPEALCASASSREDSLTLAGTNDAKWTSPVGGAIAAIAAGPQAGDATAAIVFVRDASGAPGTAMWLLTRRGAR